MSDTVTIVNSVIAFMGTAFAGIMAYMMARLNRQQTVAAIKVEEVAVKVAEVAVLKKATAERLEVIEDTSKRVETLVNNQTSILKKDLAEVREHLAALLPSPENIRAAQLARQASNEHEANQKKLDDKEAGKG